MIAVLPDDGVVCDMDACANGAQAACDGQVCQNVPLFPCAQCVPPVGGVCNFDPQNNACRNGGITFCARTGEECSLTNVGPICMTCIPPNACGNGRIDPLQPTVVDAGCQVSGASGQYCMPAGQVPVQPGVFHPAHQCYVGAHCQNINGSCTWERTSSLLACFEREGGDPGDAGDWQQQGQLIGGGQTPSPLLAQVGGGGEEPECIIVGCSGELCVDAENAPIATTCELVPGAACYRTAVCESSNNGCGWRETPELTQCLTNNAASGCASGQSCLSRTECSAFGGSAGNACGPNRAQTCCSGVIGNNQPLEQCDDGNRIDGDGCNNNCEINCDVDADCPEGACAAGQCVAQCVLPPDDGDTPDEGCNAEYPICVDNNFDGPATGDEIPQSHCSAPSTFAVMDPNPPMIGGCGPMDRGLCHKCVPPQEVPRGAVCAGVTMQQQIHMGFNCAGGEPVVCCEGEVFCPENWGMSVCGALGEPMPGGVSNGNTSANILHNENGGFMHAAAGANFFMRLMALEPVDQFELLP